MSEQTQTLAELKGEEVLLRDKIEQGRGTLQDVLELNKNRVKVVDIEQKVLRTIMLLLVSAVIFVTGCQTIKGMTGDSAWMLQKLSDNVQPAQEK